MRCRTVSISSFRSESRAICFQRKQRLGSLPYSIVILVVAIHRNPLRPARWFNSERNGPASRSVSSNSAGFRLGGREHTSSSDWGRRWAQQYASTPDSQCDSRARCTLHLIVVRAERKSFGQPIGARVKVEVHSLWLAVDVRWRC